MSPSERWKPGTLRMSWQRSHRSPSSRPIWSRFLPSNTRLESLWPKLASQGVGVALEEGSQGLAKVVLLVRWLAVRIPVVLCHELVPGPEGQLGYGQIGRSDRGPYREGSARGLPLGEDAAVFGVGIWRAVCAEEAVPPTPARVGQSDDGLAAGLVESVGREGAFRRARHATPLNAEEFRIKSGSVPHSRPPRGNVKYAG